MADNVEIVPSKEIWITIPNYANYQISSIGRVKSLEKTWFWGRYKTPRTEPEKLLSFTTYRYAMVVLCRDGKATTYGVHRLVAQSFLPNPENKPQINHKNGVKTDNRVENLEWCTAKENSRHSIDTGLKITSNYGKRNGMARIVLDTNTGIFYDTIREAATAKNINYNTLANKLSGYHKTNKTGMVFA